MRLMSSAAALSTPPSIELPPGAAVVGAAPDWCVATYGNVMLLHVHGHINAAFLGAALAGHHAALAVEPSGYGVIIVCEAGTKIPSGELREKAAVLRKQTQHMLRAQSLIIAGDGFFASAMRGVITGIVTLAQSRVPFAMAGSEREAAEFVIRRACAPSTRPEDVVEVIRALRARALP